jgi:O-antigen biosynthesis protein WbqP
MIKRSFDVLLASVLFVILAIPIALLSLLVKATSTGPTLYWSDRVGRNNEIFRMPKFRTMQRDTPTIATHLLDDPDKYLTPIGGFLRRTSLDELPQLWSIIKGEMSFVGPRPALFNQEDLIALRIQRGVHQLKPGLTGWAQVNGRDVIWLTFIKVIQGDGVSH